MDKVRVTMVAILSAIMNWLGVLAIPVFLLVGSNVIDYLTGLFAAKNRNDGGISSYKSIRGVTKKVCMWLLVIVGAMLDALIQYAVSCTGATLDIPFIVATTVAVWLVVNEIISILENMLDIGITIPPFLMPIVKYVKRYVEESVDIAEDDKEDDEDE